MAFEYWDQVRQVAVRNENMFAPAAGRVRPNIFNVDDPEGSADGYFYATEINTIRAFVFHEFAGMPRQFCPTIKPLDAIVCEGCLVPFNSMTFNSSLEQPVWWTE